MIRTFNGHVLRQPEEVVMMMPIVHEVDGKGTGPTEDEMEGKS